MQVRSVWLGSVALALALALPGAAGAAVSFSSTVYPLPAADSEYHSRIGAVSVVDLNNDARRDIVVYRGGGNVGRLFVLLGQGSGAFGTAQEYPVCANSDGGTMVTGQFNAGQAADVILGCEAATGHDQLLGNGDGTLGDSTNYPDIGMNTTLALWPSDNGSVPDVLYGRTVQQYLCHKAVNELAIESCPPDASVSDAGGPSGHAAIGPDLATAHFYNSTCGRDDVIVSPYQRSVRAWGLNPFGSLSVPACLSFSYTERQLPLPSDVVLAGISPADLNGDGTPDLVMNGGPQGASDRLVALIWQKNAADLSGGFPPGQQPVVTSSIPGIDDQQVADIDGDGHVDVAVAGNNGALTTGTLAIQRGRGDGSFDTPATFPIPGGADHIGPNRLAVGDLNGDGRADVVTVAMDDPSVAVLLNGTPTPPAVVPPAPAVAADTTPPALRQVRLTHTTFAVGSSATALTARALRGTSLSYILSEASRVTVSISRRESGARRGRTCVPRTRALRRAKRCTRDAAKGTLVRSSAAGANTLAFSGRLGTRKLPPGAYRMTIVAADGAGNRSGPTLLAFKIVNR